MPAPHRRSSDCWPGKPISCSTTWRELKAGKLRALAVTTAQRASALPEVPTMAEAGLTGFDVSTWFGVFAPAGTPREIVARLNTAFTTALRSPEMRERLARMGAEPAPERPSNFRDCSAASFRNIKQSSSFQALAWIDLLSASTRFYRDPKSQVDGCA